MVYVRARSGLREGIRVDYWVQRQWWLRRSRGTREARRSDWFLALLFFGGSACGGQLNGGEEKNIGVPFAGNSTAPDAGLVQQIAGDASSSNPGLAAESLGAAPGQWQWVQQPGTRCLDGSPSGFAVNLQAPTDPLVVYLDSGGACSDELTCAHPAVTRRFAAGEFELRKAGLSSSGLLNRLDSANAFQSMNYVFVPHCTGDWHAGTLAGTDTDLNFLGFANVRAVVERVAPLFPEASAVILMGAGAGGFGTFFNFQTVAEAFAEREVHVFNDSGPLLAATWMSAGFQKTRVEAWAPATVPNCEAGVGSLDALYDCLQRLRPTSRFALATSQWDSVNRTALRAGPFSPPLSEVDYAQAIDQLRGRLAESDQWRVFVEESSRHVLALGSLEQSVASGDHAQRLQQFAQALVTGEGFAQSAR